MTKYSFMETTLNVFDFAKTKLVYPGARLIRHPFYCRGKRSMKYGRGLTTGRNCRFDMPGDRQTLSIGRNCNIGDNVHIVAYEKVVIGEGCLLASKIFISDTSHGLYDNSDAGSSPAMAPNKRKLFTKPVKIGENVWIGENVVVLPGVSVGSGSILGAGAVVTKDVPEMSIVVGNPAKVMKCWNPTINKWEKV